ncbi:MULTISPECIES: hypothetical protein [Pseudomonas]|jgi:hypothetical protein|uniref:Uncharacterized protein n=1 Tax=Pseudomonas monachiensis TaxID=3060212 RepID=A0ABW9HEQ9_9PSED
MPIMCCRSKYVCSLFFLLLGFMAVSGAFADTAMPWVSNEKSGVILHMEDGSLYRLKLNAGVGGVFYDRHKYPIAGETYLALFEVSPSNPGKPTGFCGAGSEVWLHVYRVADTSLRTKTRTLVSSCLRSISMASQNSGTEKQDTDFSSVQWNEKGFSIDWFNHVNAAGQALTSTNYVLHGKAVSIQEVLSQ